MDNLFDYIIILFIIYGIFKSLFPKKKPDNRKESEEIDAEGVPHVKRRRTALEEILGIPPIDPEPVEPESGPKSYQEEYSTWDPEQEFSDKKESSVMPTPIREIETQSKIDTEPIFIRGISKSIEYPLSIDSELDRIDSLKEKLLNPSELRDYILISEILNKPKALQD